MDSKAIQDVARLVDFLRNSGQVAREVLLAGFSDNIGADTDNLALSQERAAAAAAALSAAGVRVGSSRGFGEARPLDSNDIEVGREKNRRVEVWLR